MAVCGNRGEQAAVRHQALNSTDLGGFESALFAGPRRECGCRSTLGQRPAGASSAVQTPPSSRRWPARSRPGNLPERNGYPVIVFSVSAGHPRTRLTSLSLARIAPGSAFRNSLGTSLVPSQSAYSVAIACTSAGSPSMGILPGPGQCRASSLARGGERPPIRRHLLVGELTQDGFRQDFFNEIVVLQDHRLAGLGSECLQGRTHAHLVPMVPALRRNDRLYERDTLHGLAMAIGPVEAEGRAPVVDDQGDPLAWNWITCQQ